MKMLPAVVTLTVLAGLAVWSSTLVAWVPGDETSCPAKGKYSNALYEFSVTIPRGLKGCPNSPVGMTDHGVAIGLSETVAIDVYGGYNAVLYDTSDEAADSMLGYLLGKAVPGSVIQVQRSHERLGPFVATHLIFKYVTKDTHTEMTVDQTAALSDGAKPAFDYAISLVVPSADYPKYEKTLKAVRLSWSAHR